MRRENGSCYLSGNVVRTVLVGFRITLKKTTTNDCRAILQPLILYKMYRPENCSSNIARQQQNGNSLIAFTKNHS